MTIFRFFLLFVFVTFITNIFGEAMPFSVIPTPQKVELSTGIFTINKATVILKGNDSEKLNYSFNKLKSCLLQYKISPEVVYGSEAEIKLIIVDKNEIFNVPEKFINQAYTLEINNKGITIKSTSYRGIFYGIMTLIQLIERSDNKLNCCKITDYPNMLIRGISDDISRGQVSTLDNFKKIIENIARYKMNTYMPYIEDVIELEGYPTIGVNRGSLTKKEILHITQTLPPLLKRYA